MKKVFAGVIVVVAIALVMIFFKPDEPIEVIEEARNGIVENLKVIDTIQTNNGMMVYSYGETSDLKNDMYFVDEVKKSMTGYSWLGGGGHVDESMQEDNDFIVSLQLLNEMQNIIPSFLGIIKDRAIQKVEVSTNKGTVAADTYEVNNELFFVGHFDDPVAEMGLFQLTIVYEDGLSWIFAIPNEDMQRLQEGYAFYLKAEDFS